MNIKLLATAIREVASRVARNAPQRSDPERFWTDKVCITQDLERLASRLELEHLNSMQRQISVMRHHRRPSLMTLTDRKIKADKDAPLRLNLVHEQRVDQTDRLGPRKRTGLQQLGR